MAFMVAKQITLKNTEHENMNFITFINNEISNLCQD